MNRPRVVVLGMLTKMPVPGVWWQVAHYLLGLERLGYETWYVEANGMNPSMFQDDEHDHGEPKAAAYLDGFVARLGLNGQFAYHAVHAGGEVYGLHRAGLNRLYADAALIINLHGGTPPLEEHARTGRLVYLETDPVQLQVELHEGLEETIAFLEPHVAFFTFGERYGLPGCGLPVSDRFTFKPTRQPVVCDLWASAEPPGDAFTTVGTYRQGWRDVDLAGETYKWTKSAEWPAYLTLPERTGATFAPALGNTRARDDVAFADHGWKVSDPGLLDDPDDYRRFIQRSRAEFTVAKDQNVRLRTGWFSDRSATYLAAGRAVVTQDTGFGAVLPVGQGLHAYRTLDEAVAAVEAVEADPEAEGKAAREIALEHFEATSVLGRLLAEVGL